MVAATETMAALRRSTVTRVRARDGVELATERLGAADAPAVVFSHGFGQTRHAWTATARAVADSGWQSIIADARGHGDSGWCDDGYYDLAQFVDDLVLIARPHKQP